MLFALFLACAPTYRYPGPLSSLGQEPAPPRAASASVRGRTPFFNPLEPIIPSEPEGRMVASTAAGLIGADCVLVNGEKYRWDCSGLVEGSMAGAEIDLQGSGANMLERARELGVTHRRKKPSPGDVAFFDNTWDKNGNGLLDDPLTHVAIVEEVDKHGTITLVHLGSSKGISRLKMNLYRPDERVDEDGNVLNDYLRRAVKGDSPRTPYLTGQLWCAFASFWEAKEVLSGEEPG